MLLVSACIAFPQVVAVAAPYGGAVVSGTETLNPDGSYSSIGAVAGGGVVFTNINYGGTPGDLTGILAVNAGSGTTNITVTGDAVGTADYGIAAINGPVTFVGNGTVNTVTAGNATSLMINAVTASGGLTGIYAQNQGTGATAITATGLVSGGSNDGVYVETGASTTGLILNLASVHGGGSGIDLINRGGALHLTATGDVAGDAGGIFIASTGTDAIIDVARVSGGNIGIQVNNQGSGQTQITATGLVTGTSGIGISELDASATAVTVNAASVSGGFGGIYALHGGSGAASVTATGTVTGGSQYGIYVSNSGIDATVNAVDVSGGQTGIMVTNGGTGAAHITATGDVAGTENYGILAFNSHVGLDLNDVVTTVQPSTANGLTVSAVNVTGGLIGIDANNGGGGATNITSTGNVSATSFYGILVTNGVETLNTNGSLAGVAANAATDLVVGTGGASGGQTGILAVNAGTGLTSVTATGDVTGTAAYGIAVVNGAATFDAGGILQSQTPSGAMGDVTVNAASVSGDRAGILVDNEGAGATHIVATGLVTATGTNGIGIQVANAVGAGDLTLNAASVSGGLYGIETRNEGTGANSITATGLVTAAKDIGVFANSLAASTSLTINAAAVTGGKIGVFASNGGSGANAIMATDQITGTANYGIFSVNGQWSTDANWVITGFSPSAAASTDLSMNVAGVSGGITGIVAVNQGSGLTDITATGAVSGASAYGIWAINGTPMVDPSGLVTDIAAGPATGLTVNAASVTGVIGGILAANSGTGATSVVATGDIAVSNDINGATISYGVLAFNGAAASNLMVQTAGVTGAVGILAVNGGTGATSVTATGPINSAGIGIAAVNGLYDFSDISGNPLTALGGFAAATGTDLTVNAADASGAVYAILALNSGTGATSVTDTGTVTGAVIVESENGTNTTVDLTNVTTADGSGGFASTAVAILNSGTGFTKVSASGTVAGGITVFNSDTATDLTVRAAGVTGPSGITVANGGTGATSVTAAGDIAVPNDVDGADIAYGVFAYNSDTATSLTVKTAGVTGTIGISAVNGGTGATSITATGPINSAAVGILAANGLYDLGDVTGNPIISLATPSAMGGTDLTINAASVTGGFYGIAAFNGGTGVTSVTTTGDVTGTRLYGILSVNGVATFNGDGTINSVAAGAATDLTVDAAGISGGVTGIYADNAGTGATNITARGIVQGGTAGINAISAGGPIAITITGAGADVHNASGDPAALAVSAAGGAVTLTNQARLTGTVMLGDAGNQMINSGVWTTGGTSNFGAGVNSLVNAASGTIQAASLSGVAEITRFSGLTTFVNRGLLSLQDGGSGDRLVTSGSVELASGSTLAVDVDDADSLHAGGTVSIDSGAVLTVNAVDRGLQLGRSTIVTADGGLTGQFAGLDGDVDIASDFLSARAAYDANNVYLDISKVRSFASAGQTPNQIATGTALDSLATSSPLFAPVALLPTDTAARTAFDHLSGEIHASLKGTLLDDSHIVRDGAEERLRAMAGVTDEHGPSVWVEGFGSWGHAGSDGNAAAISHSTGGILGGVDVAVFDTWRVGFMGGYSHTDFDVTDRASSGESDNYHLAAYGGSQWGALALRAGAAYSWHAITTARAFDVTGTSDQLNGLYNAGTTQVFAELGYGLSLDTVALEPFANLAYVNLQTGGFDEHGGIEALHSDAAPDAVTFTTLGLHATSDVALRDITANLKATLGWQHAMGDITPVSRFAFDGGNAFTIAGVPLAEDAAIVEAGFSLPVARIASFDVSYVGQFGGHVTDNGIKASLAVKF